MPQRKQHETSADRDKRQDGLRDVRTGAYDPGGKRRQPVATKQADLPEGLRRPRKGPYDKEIGRNEEVSQVPAQRTRSHAQKSAAANPQAQTKRPEGR
jgi:hypothetical protein